MRFLPLFADLSSGAVALIGAGAPARAKLRLLRSAGANVRWFSGDVDVSDELLMALASPGRVAIDPSDPLQADYADFVAVIAATGDARDAVIAERARASNTFVNVVDRPDLSNFIMPAIVDRGEVVVAIGTGGASPVLARRLRERIEAVLPARVGDLAALMVAIANNLPRRVTPWSLRCFWERVIDGPIGIAALAGRRRQAEAGIVSAIEEPRAPEQKSGVVHLVGAGPGDPDLLTLRALQALQNADVVFYDELITPEILDRARRDAERIFVGKRRGRPGIGQRAINERLVAAAREGPTSCA